MPKRKKIILSGGGTGGSVSPLFSIRNEFNERGNNFDFVWVGTRGGIEYDMVNEEGMEFIAISSGKLRRYFSLKNFIDIFKIFFGFLESILIIIRVRPKAIITVGGFVSVPLAWAGWIFRVPILIHQQDVKAGLANKLMAPFAKKITVAFEKSLKDYNNKASWVGNPFKFNDDFKGDIKKELGLNDYLPIVLIIGGGTGSIAINNIVKESISKLSKIAQIIHIYGKGKKVKIENENYHGFEFLEHRKVISLLKIIDLVVSRAGLGTLTEFSFLGNVVILIPLPDTHQEDNAQIFKEKEAAIVLKQKELVGDLFVEKVKYLLNNKKKRDEMVYNISRIIKSGASSKIVDFIIDFGLK